MNLDSLGARYVSLEGAALRDADARTWPRLGTRQLRVDGPFDEEACVEGENALAWDIEGRAGPDGYPELLGGVAATALRGSGCEGGKYRRGDGTRRGHRRQSAAIHANHVPSLSRYQLFCAGGDPFITCCLFIWSSLLAWGSKHDISDHQDTVDGIGTNII